jgi:archaellum component FlaC
VEFFSVIHFVHGKEKDQLETLAEQTQKGFAHLDSKIDKLDQRMERGFGAVADDIPDIKRDMATKDQIIALHTQVNGIETDIKTMKGYKLPSRVAAVEEELLGKARG